MNERMQQLADQAEKYADNNFKGEPTYSEAYDSKFAELIVSECMKLNGKELAMAGHSRMVDVYCKHFGIKL